MHSANSMESEEPNFHSNANSNCMIKATRKNIDDFFRNNEIAVIGASRNGKSFGNAVIKELASKGYTVSTIHKEAAEIDGIKCFSSVADLPDSVKAIYISVNKNNTNKILEESFKKGITNIWIQQMSLPAEVFKIENNQGVNIVSGECIMMFMEPVHGIHKFHRGLKGFFGKLPK